MMKFNIIEFYHNEESVITEWISKLRDLTIKTDLKAEYNIIKMVGKG